MLQVILGLAAILILFVFILLFRVQSLIAVLRGSDKQVGSISNKFNAFLMLVFFFGMTILFVWYTFAEKDTYILPESASLHGLVTDQLFWLTMVIITVTMLITNGLLFIFAYKYQYDEKRVAAYVPEHNLLEMLWTVIPAIVLTVLVFKGYAAWTDVTTIPEQFKGKNQEYVDAGDKGVLIEVMAQQFAWNVRYPGVDGKLGEHNFRLIDDINGYGLDFSDENSFDDITPTKIVIPVNVPVLFKIRSRDVLHSVYAPHFRVKMDAVPGQPTTFAFTPRTTTSEMRAKLGNDKFKYELACAEMCGRNHFSMSKLIEVVTMEEYKEWIAKQTTWVSNNSEYVKEKGSTDLVSKYLNESSEEAEVVEPVIEEEIIDSNSVEIDSTVSH